MSLLRASHLAPLLLVSLAVLNGACSDPTGNEPNPSPTPTTSPTPGLPLVAPSAEAVQGSRNIQAKVPGAAVYFSQRTGAIARVDSAGLTGLSPVSIPLVEARGTDAASERSALLEFMLRHKTAYGLVDPSSELRVPMDAANDSISVPQDQFSNEDTPQLQGMRVRRLVQTVGGLPIPGREVIGYFDQLGGLQSVATRLLPVTAIRTTPSVTATALWSNWASLRSSAAQRSSTLGWLGSVSESDATLEHASELAIEMITPDGMPDSADPSAKPRLVHRLAVRLPGLRAMLLVDAQTGELIEAIDTMPSDWHNEGVTTAAGANDEIGRYTIFLNSTYKDERYMTIVPSNGIPAWLSQDKFVAITDASTLTDPSMFSNTPIKIPTTRNGKDNNWSSDPTLTTPKRQVGPLMSIITQVFDYWKTQRGWTGWDGQGSEFWAGILTNKTGTTTPQLNAWGGNGVIQIGDGTTPTGQYYGSSRIVMGHELSHNIVSATAKLEYQFESGAVDEALADFFGLALIGNRTTDDFSVTGIGSDVGNAIRDIQKPSLFGDPEHYSNFRKLKLNVDSGGVHTNSGIINKAHALLVRGGTFSGIVVGRVGLKKVEQVLWAAMRFKMFSPSTSMEEFAHGVVSACQLIHDSNRIFGDESFAGVCSKFRRGYEAVGVLPSFFAYAVRATSVQESGRMKLAIQAGQPYTTGKSKLTVTSALEQRFTIEVEVPTLNPGDDSIIEAQLPSELLAPQAKAGPLAVELQIEGVSDLNASSLALRSGTAILGSDLVVDGFDLQPISRFPVGRPDYELKATAHNTRGTGFLAGTSGMILGRTGAHARWEEFTTLTGRTTVEANTNGEGPVSLMDAFTLNSDRFNFANGLSTIDLPQAKPVIGLVNTTGSPQRYEVWFDAQGGLPELEGRLQVYVLVDAANAIEEINETNNLWCANCRAPGQPEGQRGVIVRLPHGLKTEALFPLAISAAAAKLPAEYDLHLPVQETQVVRLPFKLKALQR